ncbi:glycosyltransferase [Pedobacter terrae]|uniref:glycosyltransferase n=1 Tax=Pedobacter terrae TaxID=405671 RepID=UPI002FF94684
MKEIREINVFTLGDSSLARTWSNVPFLLTKTLEKSGYTVNRINITPNRLLQFIFNRFIHPLTRYIKKDNVFLYERTWMNDLLTNQRIKRFNKRYPNADLNIFTNFSFLNRFSNKPNVLFCDWDLHIGINQRMGRRPYYFEQLAIDRQRKVIEKSDLIISLFPKSAEDMKNRYAKENICHLKQNVINSLYQKELIEKEIIDQKNNSHDLLFIGSVNYISGANLLIEAYQELKSTFPSMKVNIVGITEEQFGRELPDDVHCYGYLDKADAMERDIYYQLLLNARIFVNPTPVWGGYSSTIEAMYFYTPIIISPYEEFTSEFGNEIEFGRYCRQFSVAELTQHILSLFNSNVFSRSSMLAHQAVSEYTWDRYVAIMMEKIKQVCK